MRIKTITWIITLAVLAAMGLPVRLAAQAQEDQKEQKTGHHHYKLIDIGTLGGPNSFAPWLFSLDINSRGLATAEADTSIPDPFAPNCLQSTCLVNHAITSQNGVQTDLGALPGGNNSSIANWINDQGAVVGMSNNGVIDPLPGFPEFSAVLWQGGRILELGTLGGNVSFANAINNQGQVVGGALNSIPDGDATGLQFNPFPVATQFRAFLWQNGVMRDLGTLGSGNDAVALFVNDRGQVAGLSYTDTVLNADGIPTLDPFFWENGRMVDIGTLGGTLGTPFHMNSRGQVVGNSNVAGDQTSHAFLWDKEKGLKDLGTLPGRSVSLAIWINEAGEIVGLDDFFNGGHGILWKNGKTIDLGTLPGDCSSEAVSINSQGQIVGNSSPDCSQDGAAVLWENGGAPVNLNTLVPPGSEFNVVFTVNINDRGEIAGDGVLPNGDVHAVLLIPCDENHADVEGCDFDTVDAATAAQVHPAQTAPSAAATSFSNVSPAERKTRIRSMMAKRNGRFGATPPK